MENKSKQTTTNSSGSSGFYPYYTLTTPCVAKSSWSTSILLGLAQFIFNSLNLSQIVSNWVQSSQIILNRFQSFPIKYSNHFKLVPVVSNRLKSYQIVSNRFRLSQIILNCLKSFPVVSNHFKLVPVVSNRFKSLNPRSWWGGPEFEQLVCWLCSNSNYGEVTGCNYFDSLGQTEQT